MARPKKNIIRLTDAEEKQLKSILYKSNTCQTLVNRCRILLALDENHPYDQCMDLFGVSRPTISNVAVIYARDGLEFLELNRMSIPAMPAEKLTDVWKQELLKLPAALPQKGIAGGQSAFLKDRQK